MIFDGKNLRYYSNQKVCNIDLLKDVFSFELHLYIIVFTPGTKKGTVTL